MKAKYALYLLISLVCSTSCFAATDNKALNNKIRSIETKLNATIGVTAIYLEKNQKVTHRGSTPFFMASTVKLPIAITFLTLVDKKQENLNRILTLDHNNSVPGTGVLHYLFEKKRMNISLKQILKYMLVISDNSASDTILKASHGPQAVTQRMSELGCHHISINRSILQTLVDTNAVDHALLNQPRPVFSWVRAFNRIPLQKKLQAWKRFQSDTRDTTTPDDMATLLSKLYKGQVLSSASTRFLIAIMEQCKTGRNRIKGLLPGNLKVAHKTGTWAITEQNYIRYPGANRLYRFASDVGIITLPQKKGHIAIAVYVKSQGANDHLRSRAIALASRAVYDHFMKKG